jgi:hypothetical protein
MQTQESVNTVLVCKTRNYLTIKWHIYSQMFNVPYTILSNVFIFLWAVLSTKFETAS